MTIQQLPDIDQVVFVHYHCDYFNEGNKIYKLTAVKGPNSQVFWWDCGVGDEKKEAKAIEEFHNFITTECDRFTIVHWNQNRPEFGPAHINERYLELTGYELGLSYHNDLELSNYLWRKYGNNYIDHPRLDNLARLNNFMGISKKDPTDRTYPTQRVLLIAKIYNAELNGELKINPKARKPQKPAKPFRDYLLNPSGKLLPYLKQEYAGKRGKMIAIMIQALQLAGLIVYDTRAELYNAIRMELGDIGSNQGINKFMRWEFEQQDMHTKAQIKEHMKMIKQVL